MIIIDTTKKTILFQKVLNILYLILWVLGLVLSYYWSLSIGIIYTVLSFWGLFIILFGYGISIDGIGGASDYLERLQVPMLYFWDCGFNPLGGFGGATTHPGVELRKGDTVIKITLNYTLLVPQTITIDYASVCDSENYQFIILADITRPKLIKILGCLPTSIHPQRQTPESFTDIRKIFFESLYHKKYQRQGG